MIYRLEDGLEHPIRYIETLTNRRLRSGSGIVRAMTSDSKKIQFNSDSIRKIEEYYLSDFRYFGYPCAFLGNKKRTPFSAVSENSWLETDPAIEKHENAIIEPAKFLSGEATTGGVFTSDAQYISRSSQPKGAGALCDPKTIGKITKHFAGEYVYGGVLTGHFGHFLIESISRLWVLDHLKRQPDGVIFLVGNDVPPHWKIGDKELRHVTDAFSHISYLPPAHLVRQTSSVDSIIVPSIGCSVGFDILGTAHHIDFLKRRLGASIVPMGSRRLYVSRSKLRRPTTGPWSGAHLGEFRLEKYLARNGYEIFHPQEHDIKTQIAKYKAATQIILPEGSAAHLLGIFLDKHHRVVLLPRRRKLSNILEAQLNRFGKGLADVSVFDLPRATWLCESNGEHQTEIEFEKLGAFLKEHDFVEDATGWTSFRPSRIRAMIDKREAQSGGKFILRVR